MGENLYDMLSTLKNIELENKAPHVEHPGIFFGSGNT